MNFTILRFDTIGSTNDEALRQAKLGAPEGLCIVAEQQTQGRGRYGRVWHSPAGAGLYFSIILRPKIETRFLPLITLMTAIAVHDTLEKTFDLDCDIKWANDIHVRDKKICGILAETCESDFGLAVVVGIGINLKSTNFPPELKETATSVEAETGVAPNIEVLLKALTENLLSNYEILQSVGGSEKIRQDWSRKSSYSFGKPVQVSLENETFSGKTLGIELDGALRVKTDTGEIKTVRAGNVEKLRRI
jgi:BirA family transcriptional regulator, biotin operon repressor / biotin---[acetyl-CoA-carboxylase] ligase